MSRSTKTRSLAWATAILTFAATLVVWSAPQAAAGEFDPGSGENRIPDSWIVTFHEGTRPWISAQMAEQFGGRAEHIYEWALQGFSFRGSEDQARRLAEHPLVKRVVGDYHLTIASQTIPTGVRRIRARHPTKTHAHELGFEGSGVRIAILDTGIQLNHPDLKDNIHRPSDKNCVSSGAPNDDHGHGTHVAGTTAASANGIGVVGVAPKATLIAVKVLGRNGGGSFSQIICGIDHVTSLAQNNNYRIVANMSLGAGGSAGSCTDGSLRQAICRSVGAGVVYTVAAGNAGRDASCCVPARYPEVITVSALDDRDGEPGGDRLASFSNYGSAVDVIAPGVVIHSTTLGGGYGNMSGTSMASPHAAGVAALLLGRHPNLSPDQVKLRLQRSGECPNRTFNSGGRTCADQGQWSGDPDGRPEPLVHALNVFGVQTASGPGTIGDYTGDGRADVGIYRPSTGRWIIQGLSEDVEWGDASTIPVPADYSGNGLTNIGFFKPSDGQWRLDGAPDDTFGGPGDIPVPADYTGDGRANTAVYRPSTGEWLVRGMANVAWGTSHTIPVPADYTGDGRAEIATFRPDGLWRIRGVENIQWGTNGDIPVPADYTGDGRAEIAVFRPSTGMWIIRGAPNVQWGQEGLIPVPADYTGDGRADVATFRRSDGFWRVRGLGNFHWGQNGDLPLPLPAAIRLAAFG